MAARASASAAPPAEADGEGPEEHLADRAYAALSKAIARCELPPGATLNERGEAARLGMSRTPLREALHRLALEGLVVTSVPRRSSFVTLLDVKDIQDSLEVRQALELAALQRVFREKRPVDMGRLEELLSGMRKAARDNDAAGYLEADEQFHLTLAAASGNERALDALQRAWVHINRARYLRPPSKRTMATTAKQHTAILDALRSGKLGETERAVAGHMRTAADLVGDLMREMPWAFTEPDES